MILLAGQSLEIRKRQSFFSLGLRDAARRVSPILPPLHSTTVDVLVPPYFLIEASRSIEIQQKSSALSHASSLRSMISLNYAFLKPFRSNLALEQQSQKDNC